MNERIKSILSKCQEESIDGPEYPYWTDLDKFAELIIQKCISIAVPCADIDAPQEAWYAIQEYFGVK